QSTDHLFGDLRASQRLQTMLLLGVLAVALAALVVFQFARERSARRAESRVHALMKNSQDLVLVVDGDGTLTFVSPAIEGLLGHTAEALEREPLTALCHEDETAKARALIADPA